METLENGLHTHSGGSSQSCHSVDTDALCKRALMSKVQEQANSGLIWLTGNRVPWMYRLKYNGPGAGTADIPEEAKYIKL